MIVKPELALDSHYPARRLHMGCLHLDTVCQEPCESGRPHDEPTTDLTCLKAATRCVAGYCLDLVGTGAG